MEYLAKLDMKKVKLKNSQRESLTKPDMQKNTDYAPSSGRDPEHTTSVNLSVDQSTHAAKKVLRMVKYKGKTSSDSDTH